MVADRDPARLLTSGGLQGGAQGWLASVMSGAQQQAEQEIGAVQEVRAEAARQIAARLAQQGAGVSAPSGSLRGQLQEQRAQGGGGFSPFDAIGDAVGDVAGTAVDAARTNIPYADEAASAVGQAARPLGAALAQNPFVSPVTSGLGAAGLMDSAGAGASAGQMAGEAIVPQEAWELGIEAIPGVGMAPDLLRGGRRLAQEGLPGLTQGTARRLVEGTPVDGGTLVGPGAGRPAPQPGARRVMGGAADEPRDTFMQRTRPSQAALNSTYGDMRSLLDRPISELSDVDLHRLRLQSDAYLYSRSPNIHDSGNRLAEAVTDEAERRGIQLAHNPDESVRIVQAAEGTPQRATRGETTPPEFQEPSRQTENLPEGIRSFGVTREFDPVGKLTETVKATRKLPPQTEAQRGVERRRRVARGAQALEAGGRTPESYRAARASQAGNLPRVDFDPPSRQFSPEETQALRSQLGDANLQFYEELRGEEALNKVLDGRLNEVTPSELNLLDSVYGRDLANAIYNRQPINWKDEILTGIGSFRTLKASYDLSAPGRQGLMLGARHPKEWAESWGPMLKAWSKEDAAKAAEQQAQDMLQPWRDQFGDEAIPTLYGRGPGSLERVPEFEPAGRTRIGDAIRRIPGIENSERAYSTFINQQKARTFNNMARSMQRAGIDDPDQYRNIAAQIDHATGFGGAPLRKIAGRAGQETLFSERYTTSRFQALTDPIVEGVMKGDMNAARFGFENLFTYLGGLAGAVELGDQLGAWDATLDPRSSDFGKIRVGGMRIDPGAGFLPLLRTVGRVATQEGKTTTGRVYDTAMPDQVVNFFRYKLAPVPSTGISAIEGEDPVGEEFTADTIREMFTPFMVDGAWEALKATGSGNDAAAVGPLTEAVGLGTQFYGEGQAAQQDIAQGLYQQNFNDLYTRDQATVNTQVVDEGIEMEISDRMSPWWRAREDGFARWKMDIRQSELAGDPMIQEALQVGEYTDLQAHMSDWVMQNYGVNRDNADAAVESMMRETRLQDPSSQDDYVDSYRQDVLDVDPGLVQAWSEAYDEGNIDHAPPPWARELVGQRQEVR